MKKVLSLVLAIMMVLSLTTVAFAETTFSDIDAAKEAELAAAVSLASSLGIIDGFPDGTFGPEKGVTRAQMAKMLVIAKGWEQIASGVSTFSDTKGHWAEGFIALATELGIIDGYPDGSFKPDAPVSYTHAVVMMMRTLGYTNENLNGGKSTAYNEAAYKTKGLSLGLFDVMPSSLVASANRGDIALMLQTLLKTPMVETNENGRPAIVKDENGDARTLITELAPITRTIDVTPAMLGEDHFVDLSGYMFHNIVVYMNENEQVIYVVKDNSVVGKIVSATNTVTDATINKVSVGGKEYAPADNIVKANEKLFVNGALATKVTEARVQKNTPIILNKVVDATTNKVTGFTVAGIILEEETAMIKVANPYKTGSTKLDSLVLALDENRKLNLDGVKVEGAVSTLEDIATNDVVQSFRADDGSACKLVVTRETVTGKVTKKTATTVVIDGTEYVFAMTGIAAVKPGTEYSFLLDMDGNIVYELTEEEAPQAITYAMVTGVLPGSISEITGFDGKTNTVEKYPQARLLLADGTTKVFEVLVTINEDGTIKEEYVNLDGSLKFDKEKIVQYSVDANGRLKIDVLMTKSKSGEFDPAKASFLGTDATVYFAITKITDPDPSKVSYKYSVVKKANVPSDKTLDIYGTDETGWKVVVINNYQPATATTENVKYGIVFAPYQIENGFEYTMLVDGEQKTYTTAKKVGTVTGSALSIYSIELTKDDTLVGFNLKAGTPCPLTLDADGVEQFTLTDAYLLVGGARHTFAENLTVYVLDAAGNPTIGSLADLVPGMTATVYKNTNLFVEVITVVKTAN